jgi:serine/threonine-protein kinase
VAAVHHPNVVRVHDHGAFDFGGTKRAYFTMDLIDGVSLDVWCGRANTTKQRYESSLPLFRQLTDALRAAHETSYLDELGFEVGAVLHGDVKPANALVDKTGNVRLVDFLQLDVQRLIDPRVLSPAALTAPITGEMGTPGFMAPEQERHGVITVATDIYGLGITFAHALANREASNPLLDGYTNSDTPAAFRALLLRMIDAKPENRPERMRDVLRDLGVGAG